MANNYDMTRYERGQVWMIRFLNKSECRGHEQMKDRPWLILSTGKFNKTSGMVTAVPITTRDSIRTPSQVLFSNVTNTENVILCESIRTFDYTSGAYTFDFMGVLSDEVLERVDVALSIHLGMHYSPLTLKKLNDAVDAIINSASSMSNLNRNAKFTDDDVLEFATKLQTLAEVTTPISNKIPDAKSIISSNISDLDNTVEPPVETKVPVEVASKNTDKNIVEDNPPKKSASTVEKSTTSKKMKWTPEVCKQFLEDANNLPMIEVMNKWGISKKTRYHWMKWYAQDLLEKQKS